MTLGIEKRVRRRTLLGGLVEIMRDREDLIEQFERRVRVSFVEKPDPFRCPIPCAQNILHEVDDRGGYTTTVWGEIPWR